MFDITTPSLRARLIGVSVSQATPDRPTYRLNRAESFMVGVAIATAVAVWLIGG